MERVKLPLILANPIFLYYNVATKPPGAERPEAPAGKGRFSPALRGRGAEKAAQ